MKKVLVATDLSERSDRALRRATLLGRQFGAGIALVHVVDDDRPRRIVDGERDEAESLLHRTAAALRDVDGVACDTHVILASPSVGIAQAVAETKPDLLVIGPHRRDVLRDVFIGTTAERTIRSVACPVLMANAPPVGRYRHVLQTTDLSDCSRDALRRFPALRIGQEARNSLLYVFDAPALRLVMGRAMPNDDREHYLAEEMQNAGRELAAFVSAADFGEVRQIVRHEASRPPHEILTAAAEEQADLIVLSTHGRTGLAKMLIGSVTEEVLRMSSIDILAIPPLRSM